jgi:DNA polymerase III subunit delta
MLIPYQNIQSYLYKEWKPPYIIYGNELFLIEQIKQTFLNAAKKNGCGYKQVFQLDGVAHAPWKNMRSELNSPSLLDGNCLAFANLPNGKPGKYGAEVLMDIVAQKLSMVLILPKVDKATQQTKWFTYIKEQACFIDVPNIDEKLMPKWIQQECISLNLNITDKNAIQWLALQFNGNLIGAYQELQKLALLYAQHAIHNETPTRPTNITTAINTNNNTEITLEQIQNAVFNVSQYNFNHLIEACWTKNLPMSARIIHYLKDQSPILYLWLMIEDIQLMLKIKQQQKTTTQSQGQSIAVLFKHYRIWGQREQILQAVLKRLTQKRLLELLQQCYNIEKQIKGAAKHSHNLWQNIQLLIIASAIS